jgi:hypothetical protein
MRLEAGEWYASRCSGTPELRLIHLSLDRQEGIIPAAFQLDARLLLVNSPASFLRDASIAIPIPSLSIFA